MARSTGFRSDLSFEEHILGHDWNVERVQPVNVFGLSRLVVLRNTTARSTPQSDSTAELSDRFPVDRVGMQNSLGASRAHCEPWLETPTFSRCRDPWCRI